MASVAPGAEPTAARFGAHTLVLSAGVWLDAMGAKRLRRAAFQAADGGAREIVLDLSGVVATDSRVGGTLSELALGLIAYGCDTALCIAHHELRALIDEVPVLCEFERFETVEEALAYLLRLPLSPAA